MQILGRCERRLLWLHDVAAWFDLALEWLDLATAWLVYGDCMVGVWRLYGCVWFSNGPQKLLSENTYISVIKKYLTICSFWLPYGRLWQWYGTCMAVECLLYGTRCLP
jgi:hypothetical protein